MPTLREWKERRPASDLKQTVTFSHSAFGTDRLVNNLFQSAQFGGNSYQPTRFAFTEPAQDGTTTLNATITFAALSQDIKSRLKSWRGAARMEPILFRYDIWDNIGDMTPLKTYSMYVRDVAAAAENVSVTVGMTNPLSVATPIIYTVQDYPGLSNI
ncbi:MULTISPECIES: hypothetical protein [Citrobacter]|jgi:hypothetical protein|uniref:hypothetical protein n=1 Tax=Citrobacter TaxID=544 RepID=UPI000DF0EEB3|nr:hypothetical protein [Citrobacter koseri]MEC5643542.1 hypothetical protein [Citrobacter koseri]WOJ04344.1 hypothetical protein R1157_07345 [Citrobacter koseri]CAG0244460.1 hypothetical protein AN2353V1_1762 [Citrobacter koseri]CAH6038086.1 hypothetical protein AN2353V1_1762 [Citrobacter koseri]STB29494.1 Uncharacterised protein [Citrobacter koseri]